MSSLNFLKKLSNIDLLLIVIVIMIAIMLIINLIKVDTIETTNQSCSQVEPLCRVQQTQNSLPGNDEVLEDLDANQNIDNKPT